MMINLSGRIGRGACFACKRPEDEEEEEAYQLQTGQQRAPCLINALDENKSLGFFYLYVVVAIYI